MLLKTHFYYNIFRLLQKKRPFQINKYKCKIYILFDHVYILLILNYKIIIKL